MCWWPQAAAPVPAQEGKNTLFFVEGCGRDGSINWGDNFSGARGFLSDALKRDFVNSIVISPHVYPPSVSQARNPGDLLGTSSGGCAALPKCACQESRRAPHLACLLRTRKTATQAPCWAWRHWNS